MDAEPQPGNVLHDLLASLTLLFTALAFKQGFLGTVPVNLRERVRIQLMSFADMIGDVGDRLPTDPANVALLAIFTVRQLGSLAFSWMILVLKAFQTFLALVAILFVTLKVDVDVFAAELVNPRITVAVFVD